LIIAGGSFALSQVTDARYKAAHHKRTLGLTKEQLKTKGWKEDTTNIFDEYKEMQENVDLNNWENIRGPRPWEDDNQKYIDVINQRIKETEERKKKASSFWAA
jgi:cytochrome c oxidase assembly protein subunit 16